MSGTSSLQIVRLTPPGRGAVATLLVEGTGAVDAVDALFRAAGRQPWKSRPDDQLAVGRFAVGLETGEEVVVRRCGGRSVELHCHGGHAAVAMIERVLVERGCRPVAWQDWAAGHHQDPIAAAACLALADARTERTAAILLDQYHGALRRALEEIEASLRRGDTASAGRQVEILLARADLGRHLVRPWRVVLGGNVNVGKSSLINALLGYGRAIVHAQPGTTRDVVTAGTAIEGWPVELSDTAGLRSGDDTVERAGVQRAEEQLAAADLAVLVFDAATPWSPRDRQLIEARPSALVVHNKCDLPPAPGARSTGLSISASTGEGVEALLRVIAARLVPDPPPPGAAVPFTAEQFQRLHGYRTQIEAGPPRASRGKD